MSRTTYYAAQWPILDEDRTTSELVAEASPDLARMMNAEGLVMTGDPEWSVAESGGQSWLNVQVPARRMRAAS